MKSSKFSSSNFYYCALRTNGSRNIVFELDFPRVDLFWSLYGISTWGWLGQMIRLGLAINDMLYETETSKSVSNIVSLLILSLYFKVIMTQTLKTGQRFVYCTLGG
jgi:hypothetical protein